MSSGPQPDRTENKRKEGQKRYQDLFKGINRKALNKSQTARLDLLLEGYSIEDIAKKDNTTRQNIYTEIGRLSEISINDPFENLKKSG